MKIYMKDQVKSSIGRSSCNNNCMHRCRFGGKISRIDMTGKSLTLKIMWPYFERKASGVFIKKVSATDLNAKKRLTGRSMSSIGVQTDAMRRTYKRKNVNSKLSLKKAKAHKIARTRNARSKAKNVKTPELCANCKRKSSDIRFNSNCEDKKTVISENNLMQYISTLCNSGVGDTSSHQAFIERVKKTASSTDSIGNSPVSTDISTLKLVKKTYTASKIESQDFSLMDDDTESKVGLQPNKDLKEINSHMVLSWNGLPYPSEFGSNASSVTITRRKRSADCLESFVSQPIQKKIKLSDNSDRVTLNRNRDQKKKVRKSVVKVEKVESENCVDAGNDKKVEQVKNDNIQNEMMTKEASENGDNENILKKPFQDLASLSTK